MCQNNSSLQHYRQSRAAVVYSGSATASVASDEGYCDDARSLPTRSVPEHLSSNVTENEANRNNFIRSNKHPTLETKN